MNVVDNNAMKVPYCPPTSNQGSEAIPGLGAPPWGCVLEDDFGMSRSPVRATGARESGMNTFYKYELTKKGD